MYLFGDKEKFGISYHLFSEIYADEENVKNNPKYFEFKSNVCLWVNGKNVFMIANEGPEATYEGSIFDIVDFFSYNLFCHITEDPFPVKTKSQNALEMIEETALVKKQDDSGDLADVLSKIDWENYDKDLGIAIDEWHFNHGLYRNTASFVPYIFFRKKYNKVEISWDGSHEYETRFGKFFLEYKHGVECIDIKLYKDTVVAFCQHVIKKYKSKYPVQMNELSLCLQKAIDVNVDE